MTPEEPIRERFLRVLERIDRAAGRAGRRGDEVRLVAVSKTQPLSRVVEARDAGIKVFGENYVQEAEAKIPFLPGAEWHLIGKLQRNKAGKAVSLFSWIETVDSARLLAEISRRAEGAGKVVPVLVEVSLAEEPGKAGIPPEGLPEILEAAAGLSGIRLKGLMAVPPPAEDPEESRPRFARLRELLEELARRGGPGAGMTELSMGMSGDFEVAVEEGATIVRVGTAIFGSRSGRSA
jgi:pyridoxal phosphate enzyme (YggS family)